MDKIVEAFEKEVIDMSNWIELGMRGGQR